jgi:MFS family permease
LQKSNIDDQEVGKSPELKQNNYGYVIVAAGCFILAATVGMFFNFGIFFKPVLNTFGWTRTMTSGAFSVASLINGVFAVIVGRIVDRVGPRLVLTMCAILLGLGYSFTSQITNIWQLYIFLGVLIGLGMSGIHVSVLPTIARWFTSRRSIMTGIVLAGGSAGMFIAPQLGNYLIANYDWRWAYIITGSIVMIIVVIAAQFMRVKKNGGSETLVSTEVDYEKRVTSSDSGMTVRKAMLTRNLWLIFGIFFIFGFMSFAVNVHIVPYATDLGISSKKAANILSLIGGTSTPGLILLGMLSDRIGNRKVIIISYAVVAISIVGLLVSDSLGMLYAFAVVFGFMHSGVLLSQSPLVANTFGTRSLGVLLGISAMALTLGASVGPPVAAKIFDVTQSYQWAFIIFIIVSVIGILLTLMLKQSKYYTGKF